MSALRERLIEDLQVRNYSPRTVEAYVAAVLKLAKHFKRSPDELTSEDVRAFQVYLMAQKSSWSQFNQIVSGLRFFFGTTLARTGVVEMLPYGKKPKKLPTVLGVAEVEVADVIRSHGAAFLSKYGKHLSGTQKKALRDLASCRTALLGGHVQRCLDCGHDRIAYNSCRNRHCPKCQALSRARWLERESAYLLPVEYHHVVFTLPAELAELAARNASALYTLLMQSAAETLREVAANPKRLGAQVGVLMVLHTWGQNLHLHPHVHCVVTGGGLSCNARGEADASPHWVSCRPGFFLPVRVLSRVYRGKFLAGLRALHTQGKLTLPGLLSNGPSFTAWLRPLYAKEWVVYAKAPFGGPEQVLKYLARYTHRVAISNHRLVKLEAGRVTFRYKDYADSRKEKLLTLSAEEFLRRFVQHVLPKGFMKIRHYGLLSSRQREARLQQARRLLLPRVALSGSGSSVIEPAEPARCPQCGSVRRARGELLPRVPLNPFVCASRSTPSAELVGDTS